MLLSDKINLKWQNSVTTITLAVNYKNFMHPNPKSHQNLNFENKNYVKKKNQQQKLTENV